MMDEAESPTPSISVASPDGLARFHEAVVDHTFSTPQHSHNVLLRAHFPLRDMLMNFILVHPLSKTLPVVVKDPFLIACNDTIEKWTVLVAQQKIEKFRFEISSTEVDEISERRFLRDSLSSCGTTCSTF
ncbi:hypothetical protein RB195_013458 [Necator americanus]|uniref:Uncharacterized protein n=1 Tax=Necator americanus TaxID=51031 RepID=A0ABR1DVL4_NECAM